MKTINPKIVRESWESQLAARRENPARVALIGNPGAYRRHVLPVGDSDDFDLYLERGRVYCVSINRSLGYAGVQGYDAEDQEPREELSIFYQDEESLREAIGPQGLDYTDRTIARRLVALIEEVTA